MKHAVAIAAFATGFGAFLFWKCARASSSIPMLAPAQKTAIATTSSPIAPNLKISSVPQKVPTLNDSPSAHAGNYLQHLANAAQDVMIVNGGADTPEQSQDVNQAWANLSLPLDILTAQKDLNVLGAQPPLVEDGVMGPKTRDAVDSFQRAMSIAPSGVLDSETSNALRRAVVGVTLQPAQDST